MMEMAKICFTFTPFPPWITFVYELNLGKACTDLFLRQYFFDIKVVFVPLSNNILQFVLSNNVPIMAA